MIRRTPRSQSGITLTEILISILILGVGMTSLLTLFPLGLLRVREASRLSRSAYLVESATADLLSRNLLSKSSFQNPYSGQWYNLPALTPWPYDPWVQDTPSYLADPIAGPPFGAYRGTGSFNTANLAPHNVNVLAVNGIAAGPGLPVCYDPLWRSTTGHYMGSALTEARFASGIGFIRNDPAGGNPSAHGLQRLTNFPANTVASVPDIFVSPEDMVLQSDTDTAKGAGTVSPIVPDLTLGTNPITNVVTPQYDWKYTWMFTGQQADATNGSVFVGDIVIFENRPFAVDTVTAPISGNATPFVAGETVVEAIFGYTNNVTSAGGTAGYGSKASRTVLLRWSDQVADPEIRVGNWIADVTYERDATVDFRRAYTDPNAGSAGAFYPYQRCFWYQIAKRTEAVTSTTVPGFREMTVWTSTPLKAFTLLNVSNGSPVHLNAALVSPYVVNVFPRTIYTR